MSDSKEASINWWTNRVQEFEVKFDTNLKLKNLRIKCKTSIDNIFELNTFIEKFLIKYFNGAGTFIRGFQFSQSTF